MWGVCERSPRILTQSAERMKLPIDGEDGGRKQGLRKPREESVSRGKE